MCILYIVPSFRGSPLEHGIFVPCTYYMPYLSTALYITHLQPAVGVFPPQHVLYPAHVCITYVMITGPVTMW